MKDVSGIVTSLLGEILACDATIMGPSFPLAPSHGVQPLDIAKLAIACEEAFHFPLFDEKVAEWKTLEDACSQISQLLEEGQGEPSQRTDEERLSWYYE